METNSESPQQQLDDLHRARTAVADRLVSPWWVHAAYGALLAALGLAAVFGPDDLQGVGYAVFVVAWLGLTGLQARRAGVQLRSWRTLTGWTWGVLMLVVTLAGMIVALGAESLGATPLALGAVAVTAVVAGLLSWRGEVALRDHVRRAA